MFQYPELAVNPFRDRVCKIFSSSHDGDCTFEDFLDMMSVFSENAPIGVKAEHAFRVYGKCLDQNCSHKIENNYEIFTNLKELKISLRICFSY